jgi:hypothetical protein
MKRQQFGMLAVLLLLVVGLAGWFWWGGPARFTTPQLTPEQARQALTDFQLSLAWLENNDYEQALPVLERLAALCPAEAAIQRHRVIGGLIGVTALTGVNEPEKVARRAELVSLTRQALEQLRSFPGEAVPWGLFSARLELLEGNGAAAVELLQQVHRAAPEDPTLAYELAQVALEADDAATQEQGVAALVSAFSVVPNNLWLFRELLVKQAEQQSPAVAETLQQALPALEVVRPGVLERTQVDVRELATVAEAAARSGDWPVVLRNARILSNVILPEDAAQSDRIQLQRHPLTFVAVNLSPAVLALVPPVEEDRQVGFEWSSVALPVELFAGAIDLCVGDFNLDEREDICVLFSDRVTVFERSEAEGEYRIQSNFPLDRQFERVLAVDLDADEREAPRPVQAQLPAPTLCRKADLDLVLSGASGIQLLQNIYDPATQQRSWEPMPLDTTLRDITAVAAVDVDIDGDLDLLIAGAGRIEQWSNRTGWKFGLRSESPQELPAGFRVRQFLPVDLDRDVDLDLLVVAEDGRCGILENLRHGILRYRDLLADGAPVRAECLAVLDWNGDASWDLLAGDQQGLRLLRGVTTPDGALSFKQAESWPLPTNQFLLADFNNSGREDVLRLDQASVDSLEREQAAVNLGTAFPLQRAEVCDFNRDGRLDLWTIGPEGVALHQNTTSAAGHWFELTLVADQYDPNTPAISSRRMNHYAIGSTVEVRAGRDYQARVVQGPLVHFGLGENTTVETLRIIWTNGIPQHHVQPPQNTLLCEQQVVGGSCPYLYAENETGTHFVTDLLWAAPLGLPDAGGGLVPARPWEYIKVPGELLSPREGRYRLHITEELREIGYYDEIRLLAVDHPPELEVHTNEKVGPPAVAEPKLHTARQLRTPLRAVNQHARDLLPQISKLDDDYARPYDDQLAHGLTEPTVVELLLDLADAPPDEPLDVRLYLTGWLHAPDAGVSAAIHEAVQHGAGSYTVPQPLSLWVPNAAGDWQAAIPFTGFVGGKTKTIVLEVGAVLRRDDPRLQLRSSMEFAWDRIAYTVNEPQVPLQLVELPLLQADLHYRGVSARRDHPRRGPDLYDYATVWPVPRFAPLGGHFTRYGDVLPLLLSQDDLLVVQGPGDELTLEFSADLPLEPGWQRDFVLYSVGWDKDAQPHTVYGTSSEPLPWHGMPSYPYLEPRPVTPEYENYLRSFQTRQQSGMEYRRAMLSQP